MFYFKGFGWQKRLWTNINKHENNNDIPNKKEVYSSVLLVYFF